MRWLWKHAENEKGQVRKNDKKDQSGVQLWVQMEDQCKPTELYHFSVLSAQTKKREKVQVNYDWVPFRIKTKHS